MVNFEFIPNMPDSYGFYWVTTGRNADPVLVEYVCSDIQGLGRAVCFTGRGFLIDLSNPPAWMWKFIGNNPF